MARNIAMFLILTLMALGCQMKSQGEIRLEGLVQLRDQQIIVLRQQAGEIFKLQDELVSMKAKQARWQEANTYEITDAIAVSEECHGSPALECVGLEGRKMELQDSERRLADFGLEIVDLETKIRALRAQHFQGM